jgi:carboxyl-terminal processing protease
MARSLRPLLFAIFVIALCSGIAGFFGPGLTRVAAATAGPEEELKSSIKQFTKVYEVVENNFADKVTSDKGVYKGAIPGMLRTLDPHSNFFDPKDFQSLRDEQSGHYYGVGMTVAPRNGKTIIVAPFGGSPAYKAGLRAGDTILEVNDKKTDNLSTTEVADLLKGPRGTHVVPTSRSASTSFAMRFRASAWRRRSGCGRVSPSCELPPSTKIPARRWKRVSRSWARPTSKA